MRGGLATRRGLRGAASAPATLLALLALVAWLAGCASSKPVTPMPPAGGGVCEDLAYVFFLVAEQKQRGVSRDAQIERLREDVRNPFSTRPEVTFDQLVQVVERVYETPHASALELEARVLDHCSVNERGEAVLRTSRARP
jgi:hypothetical protein